MNEYRLSEAVEAAACALHESIRERHQFRWATMSEQWRVEMRAYVRPAVLAALKSSDEFMSRSHDRRVLTTRPRLEMVPRKT